jgi:hypothetical protein
MLISLRFSVIISFPHVLNQVVPFSIFACANDLCTHFNQRIMPIALPDDVPIGLVIIQHWKVPNLASNFPQSSKLHDVQHKSVSYAHPKDLCTLYLKIHTNSFT